jgi:hypothetical protein
MSNDAIADVTTRAAEAERLLAQFFSAPNHYRLPGSGLNVDDQAKAVPEPLLAAIDNFRRGRIDRPVLLPLRLNAQECTWWYACSADQRSKATLQAELMAFVGPSFARWMRAVGNNGADAFVLEAARQSGMQFFGFQSSKDAYDDRIVRLWSDYIRMLDWQPSRTSIEVRSFAKLRAAFDRALVAKNEHAALSVMATLKERHAPTAENRAFLEIRLHAALGRWDAILSHRLFSQLLELRLPPEIYGDVWDALYEVHIRSREALGQWAAVLGAYAQIQSMAAPLLRQKSGSTRPAVLKCVVLNELLNAEPSVTFIQELLAKLGPGAFGEAGESVRSRVQELVPRGGWEVALSEMNLERYEQAFGLLLDLPDSSEVQLALLQCAKEIDDPVRAGQAMDRLQRSNARDEIQEKRPRLTVAVQTLAERALLAPIPQEPLEPSSTKAEDTVNYWREVARSQGSQALGTSIKIEVLIEAIEQHALDETSVFDSLLPILIEWLVERCAAEARLIRVYLAFIESLCLRDQVGDTELEVIRLTTVHALVAGPSQAEYSQLMSLLSEVFKSVRAARTLGWAIDVADALATNPCKDDVARSNWLAEVLGTATEFHLRTSFSQRALLRLIASESGINLPAVLAEAARREETEGTNARILIYSLDGHATRRVAQALGQQMPRVRVDTSEDQTCTPRLRTNARNSDFVVFVSSVATHQAFYCIKDALKSGDRLVQVQGTGTTRILDAAMSRLMLGGTP